MALMRKITRTLNMSSMKPEFQRICGIKKENEIKFHLFGYQNFKLYYFCYIKLKKL